MEKNDIKCNYSMTSFFGFRTRYGITIRFHWSLERREKSHSSSFSKLSKSSKDGGHKFACWRLFVRSRIVGIFHIVGGRFSVPFPGLYSYFTNLYELGITAAHTYIHTYIQIMFWTNGTTTNSYHHLNIDGQERYVNGRNATFSNRADAWLH